jgi:hypothetical protein
MRQKRQIIAYSVLLIVMVWAVLPWLIPAYSHNLVMTVGFLNGRNPTYEINLRNLTPWPVRLMGAQWFVIHSERYSYWNPSEAPRQEFWLLPFQSHSFQFTIYNECYNGRQYYNGSVTVQLRADINAIGATSQVVSQTFYNSTSPFASSRATDPIHELNC